MSTTETTPSELRDRALARLRALSPEARETLLIQCWMSHDARWFMAAAAELGMPATNRLNQTAARELGKVEARRLAKAIGLPNVEDIDGYLEAQETIIALLGPELLDYRVEKLDHARAMLHVERCFAFDNVKRAGVADQYDCGILPRVEGWLAGLAESHTISPTPGPCLKARGQPCRYELCVGQRSAPEPRDTPE